MQSAQKLSTLLKTFVQNDKSKKIKKNFKKSIDKYSFMWYNLDNERQQYIIKGKMKMRLIHYTVINKETNKREYTNCDRKKCEKFLAKKQDEKKFAIAYKWVSI